MSSTEDNIETQKRKRLNRQLFEYEISLKIFTKEAGFWLKLR